VDGEKIANVTIALRGWVTMIAPERSTDPEITGSRGWEGHIVGVDQDLFNELRGKTFTLRTPDGRGTAFLANDRGQLHMGTDFQFDT